MDIVSKICYAVDVVVGLLLIAMGVVTGSLGAVFFGFAFSLLAVMCWYNESGKNQYMEAYRNMDRIAADAVRNAQGSLDSHERTLEMANDMRFVLDLFLEGLDVEAADAINDRLESGDRNVRLRSVDGEWRLFAGGE